MKDILADNGVVSDEEKDILEEVMNIGFGNATADLAEVIDIYVKLSDRIKEIALKVVKDPERMLEKLTGKIYKWDEKIKRLRDKLSGKAVTYEPKEEKEKREKAKKEREDDREEEIDWWEEDEN